jgi:hypothetical protein
MNGLSVEWEHNGMSVEWNGSEINNFNNYIDIFFISDGKMSVRISRFDLNTHNEKKVFD